MRICSTDLRWTTFFKTSRQIIEYRASGYSSDQFGMQVRQTKALRNMVDKALVRVRQRIYIADNHPLLLRLVILENNALLQRRLLSPKPSQAPHSGCCPKHAHTPECSSSFSLFIQLFLLDYNAAIIRMRCAFIAPRPVRLV